MVKDKNLDKAMKVKRIGIMLSGFGKTDLSAFRFLVLRMNTLQNVFEFEFLPLDRRDPFLKPISNKNKIDREAFEQDALAFLERHEKFLWYLYSAYDLEAA